MTMLLCTLVNCPSYSVAGEGGKGDGESVGKGADLGMRGCVAGSIGRGAGRWAMGAPGPWARTSPIEGDEPETVQLYTGR